MILIAAIFRFREYQRFYRRWGSLALSIGGRDFQGEQTICIACSGDATAESRDLDTSDQLPRVQILDIGQKPRRVVSGAPIIKVGSLDLLVVTTHLNSRLEGVFQMEPLGTGPCATFTTGTHHI